MLKTDIVVDLQYGDTGKGKVTHHLLKAGKYTHCIRYNGGGNAGHTIYHNGEKFVTHQVPAGVFYGIKSIIGPGCVVNPKKLFEEIEYLENKGISCSDLIKISNNTHIIMEKHLQEDGEDEKIGTCKTGNGPAYRDKYGRKGIRAELYPSLKEFCIDFHTELFDNKNRKHLLLEGAQGFGLDIDHGDYPYVTSSHCTVAGALLNGIPYTTIEKVWGVIKCYETYVGNKKFQPKDLIFEKIQQIGNEYGATTSRKRQVNWLDFELLKKATLINGITDLVINKMDVLREIGEWKIRTKDGILSFDSEKHFSNYLIRYLPASMYSTIEKRNPLEVNIKFSDSPNEI